MTFSIIGTGNTAWFMATRLADAGHSCRFIYGRDIGKIESLANAVNSKTKLLANGITDDVDVCILAVSDHAIAEVASQLKLESTVLVHTAGAVGIKELENAAKHYGVIWPVYSIIKNNLPSTRDIPTVWEASDQIAGKYITELLQGITDINTEASSEQRKWLHLSAVMSNNFTNHLFSIAEQLCKEQNLPFHLLYPIIRQSVSRLQDISPYQQQTGPAKRNDTLTMQRQSDMLQQHPTWQKLYETLSNSIKEMYKNTTT